MSTEHTMRHLLDLAAVPAAAVPKNALTLASFSLFDWLVVARAGVAEPLSRIVRDVVEQDGGRPVATVVGLATRVPARAAALANGTISHALDYDDTHFAHIGHLSVGIMPAALAMAEQLDAPATHVRDAFVIGAEAACRIGMVLGRGHYEHGFHQTATAGAFGATVAAGRLLGLTDAEMRNALSLVATRASGLKSQFGTMGKPYNAGIAAANGVECASLAKRGFISCDDGVGGPQGFIETHAVDASETAAWADPPPASFVFENNKYKLHACCHGLHAMINALVDARTSRTLRPEDVVGITVKTNPRWLRVCDIKRPRTGLEAKFSYGMLAAMVLHGISTAADSSYTDALGTDEALLDVARRVTVEGDARVSDTATHVSLALSGGGSLEIDHDLAARLSMPTLEAGLREKARALLGDAEADRIWSGVQALEQISARDLAALLAA